MKRYCLRGEFLQIGHSKYYFGVWYKITNPNCLYKSKEDDEALRNPFNGMGNFLKATKKAITAPDKNQNIGYFARQPFSSIKLFMDGDENESGHFCKGENAEDHIGEILWECRMFLDTLDCGSESIAVGWTKEEVYEKVVQLLDEAGAVVDIDESQEEIKKYLKSAKEATENAEFLNNLIISENPHHFENTKKFKRNQLKK